MVGSLVKRRRHPMILMSCLLEDPQARARLLAAPHRLRHQRLPRTQSGGFALPRFDSAAQHELMLEFARSPYQLPVDLRDPAPSRHLQTVDSHYLLMPDLLSQTYLQHLHDYLPSQYPHSDVRPQPC